MTTETSPGMEDVTGPIVADIEAAIAAADWPRANDLSNRAISRGLRHPVFFMVRAQRMEETGHLQFAFEDYRRAAALAPHDVRAHDAVGMCAMKLENFQSAVEAFDAALALGPNVAAVHFRRGLALASLGDHEAALGAYEAALKLEPQFPDALANLAAMIARKGEAEKARRLAADALALQPHHPTAIVAQAVADISERKFADAEARLSTALSDNFFAPHQRPGALGLLGDAIDGQKRYADAFAAYRSGNNELRKLNAARFAGNHGTNSARNLIGYFEREEPKRWVAPVASGTSAAAAHVFLLGFMRSGTTLLEQVLASNPNIVALEERGLLIELGEKYMTSVPALDSLAAMTGEEAARERDLYWQRVRQQGVDVSGKVFVDKQPLNTTKLPIIAKLFPKAKILFALRDPRDVVFSCFRRHFKISVTMYEYLALDDTARFYSAVMRLGELFREKLALDVHEHRYEAMVQDFEGQIRAVCEFIGVEWNETMHNFNELVPVADLRSPSATQVRRPLYGEGIGQWRNYAGQMSAVLPILRPWVDKFGYPVD
jgi:tetratricopeptide (TPR) repeat protein